MPDFSGSTDEKHVFTLPSEIDGVYWDRRQAAPDGTVGLRVQTIFCADGSQIRIKLQDAQGTVHSTLSGKLRGNGVNVDLQVPPKAKGGLLAKVKMPNHGLWAEPRGAPDERRAIVCIFERDPGRGAHDALTQLRPRVEGRAVEMKYQCQHPRDTAELPLEWKVPDGYTQPEFFNTVEVDGITANSKEASSRGLIDT